MNTRANLVQAAADLFYARGIAATGVDQIAASSGYSKPTLYKHFRSKDELIAAVMEMRGDHRKRALEAIAAQHADDPDAALQGIMSYYAEWFVSEDYRGCALVNGAIELSDPGHRARAVVRDHKAWMTGFLERLARRAGYASAGELARTLVMLEEGAAVMAYVDDAGPSARQFERAAKRMLAQHPRPGGDR